MMLRILGGTLLVLLAIGFLVLVVGWRLPVGHVATRSAVVPASVPSVFARVNDFRSAPTWRSSVTAVDVEAGEVADGVTRYREHSSDGVIPYEVIEREVGRRLVTRIADPSLPFGGRWIFEFTQAPGGTEVRITEEGEVYNPVFRFMSRFVFGHTRSIDGYLNDLRASFTPAGTPASPATGVGSAE